MNLHTPEISELKARVEDRYQRNLKTSTDFEEFSLYLSNFFQEKVSASTLKRLWEYVGDSHNPRVNTLDVLARYIDFQSFKAFCEDLKRSTYYNSSFISIEKIMSEELQTLCFFAGANSIFYCDKLLTTNNAGTNRDIALFEKLGLRAI